MNCYRLVNENTCFFCNFTFVKKRNLNIHMKKMQPPDLSCHFCLSPNAVRPPPYNRCCHCHCQLQFIKSLLIRQRIDRNILHVCRSFSIAPQVCNPVWRGKRDVRLLRGRHLEQNLKLTHENVHIKYEKKHL